jgi:hypothetical protein
MTARVHCAGWMLKVRRSGPSRGGHGWPDGDPVTTIQFGGMHEGDDGAPLLEIVGDDAVRDLIEKLQAVLK